MARTPSRKKLDETSRLIRRWRREHESLRVYHRAMRLEYGYNFKLKHHSAPDPTKPLRKQPLTVSTLDLYDTTRYAAWQIDNSEIYMDVRPSEPGEDELEQADLDDGARIVRSLMDEHVHDVRLGYPRVRRAVIRMGQGVRVGAAMLDVIPGGEMGADVVPRVVKPWLLSWDTRFAHPLSHGNKVVWEVHEKVPLDWVHDNPDFGPSAKDVKPDDGHEALEDTPEQDPAVERDEDSEETRTCTLVTGWLMDDEAEVEVQVGEDKKLEPARWYMGCAECGYSERDLSMEEDYDGSGLPERLPCPKCGAKQDGTPVAMMHRMERERSFGRVPEFENRHRRIVLAPCSPECGLLRDGPWPKRLTHFPLMYHVPDPFPIEPTGNSHTFLQMDLQSLKNASVVAGFEQMERNRDLLIAKEDSLWDAQHEPYQFDGSGDYVAYVESYDDLQGIKHVQGQGLNQSFPTWMDRLDTELRGNRGIGQASLTPEQMKGVNVGTIARSMETGDVPLDGALRVLREDEEGFFNRWLELLCGAWSRERWVEVSGGDGDLVMRLFLPGVTPRLKLRVNASPNMNAVNREQMRAAKELDGITSPTLLRYAAESSKLPRHVVDGLVKERTAPQPGAAPPGLPGPEGLPGAGGLPPMPGAVPGRPGLPGPLEPATAAVS